MPYYEYRCVVCRKRFEIKQGIKAGPITRCPECEGKVERVIQRVAFIIK